MAVSSDLISQLVKVNKEPKKASETTSYGTTVEYEGRTYVKLDGSDLLTPVNTTSSIKDGDRVTVLIKDHTATVTGNMSDPAASSTVVDTQGKQISDFEIVIADKVSTKELDAEKGRIDDLVSDNILVKEKLTATEADIKDLQAENVTITEKLTANEAEIGNLKTDKLDAKVADITYATIENLKATNADIYNLEATYGEFEKLTTNKFEAVDATIENLDSTYATIKELDAEKARIDDLETNSLTADSAVIKDLEADVADIDTLIFGSASGTSIQTSFANAVIAQLGNAQIKSAMIDSVSASKIAAGDIITNNVRVKSEDGSLLISDETIQISDDNRVRVQIGKDASNDYSISIWDADGNLMFSEGGITDNAIKEAIIRNDMVSNDANISASKLDISSLFKEINGSTETIKGTRIYLDDEKQTLDVAFTAVSSELDGLENDVKSQGTALSVVQGQISSKVWQQDIDTATGQMNTKYSSLEQEVDGISATVASHTTTIANKADASTVTAVNTKVTSLEANLSGFQTTVSNTYATKSEVEDIEIGGRNLLYRTKEFDAISGVSEIVDGTYKDFAVRYLSCVGATVNKELALFNSKIEVEPGAQYTLSFYAKGTRVRAHFYNGAYAVSKGESSQGTTNAAGDGGMDFVLTDEWKRYWVVYTMESANSLSTSGNKSVLLRVTPGYEAYVCGCMFEKGNKPSDWTPAPEDVATNDELSRVETRVTQTENSIVSQATQLDSLGTRVSSVEQTATSLTSRVTSTETAINTLEIGGRNYLRNTKNPVDTSHWTSGNVVYDEELKENVFYINTAAAKETYGGTERINVDAGDAYTISLLVKRTANVTSIDLFFLSRKEGETSDYSIIQHKTGLTTPVSEWTKVSWTFEMNAEAYEGYLRIDHNGSSDGTDATLYYTNVKMEKGTKATDWTAAPEEVEETAERAQLTADNAQSISSEAVTRVTVTESEIKQLADMIATLVVDGNGASLMTQTANGWSFNIGEIVDTLTSTAENYADLSEGMESTNSDLENLKQAVNDLGVLADYVIITTYNGQPCIELGEAENDFKLRITNTEIQFADGSVIPAYLSNQKLYIEKAEVKNELQFGGFVWKTRSNGNMGLIWKGVSS